MNKTLPSDRENLNNERAEYAHKALTHFQLVTGMRGESLPTIIQDFLCNMAHLCDRNDLNLGELLMDAEEHYAAETESTGEQFFDIITSEKEGA